MKYLVCNMDKIISDIFSSISVLLFFLGVVLDLYQRDSVKFSEITPPDKAKFTEVKKFRRKYRIVLFEGILVLILCLSFTYILFPTVIVIFKSSILSLWNFEIIRTLFVLLIVFLLGFTYFSISFLIKHINYFRKTGL